jgi:hypothetical protein
MKRWGLLWRHRNRIEGEVRHLISRDGMPALFRTRREACEHARKHFGYIATRKDLRCEPFGWRMPVPVRVTVQIESTKGEQRA